MIAADRSHDLFRWEHNRVGFPNAHLLLVSLSLSLNAKMSRPTETEDLTSVEWRDTAWIEVHMSGDGGGVISLILAAK